MFMFRGVKQRRKQNANNMFMFMFMFRVQGICKTTRNKDVKQNAKNANTMGYPLPSPTSGPRMVTSFGNLCTLDYSVFASCSKGASSDAM